MTINSINNIDHSNQNLSENIQKMATQLKKDPVEIKLQKIEPLKEEEKIEDQTEETGFDVTA